MPRDAYTYRPSRWVSCRRVFRSVLLGILVLWGVLPVYGQEGPVWIELAPGVPTEAQHGRPLTLSFALTNASGAGGAFTDVLVLPRGWRTILDARSFVLEAGAQTIRIVTVLLPEKTRAGVYEVTYRVLPVDQDDCSGERVLPITLPVRYEVALEPLDAPRFAVSGMAFTSTFLLENKGNTPVTVKLDFNKQERWTVEANFTEVRLGPAEVRLLSVKTRFPTRASRLRWRDGAGDGRRKPRDDGQGPRQPECTPASGKSRTRLSYV